MIPCFPSGEKPLNTWEDINFTCCLHNRRDGINFPANYATLSSSFSLKLLGISQLCHNLEEIMQSVTAKDITLSVVPKDPSCASLNKIQTRVRGFEQKGEKLDLLEGGTFMKTDVDF